MSTTEPQKAQIECAELLKGYEEKKFMIVHCTYKSKTYYHNDGWITIMPEIILSNEMDNEKLSLLYAVDIPIVPQKHHFSRPGEILKFTLVFDKYQTPGRVLIC